MKKILLTAALALLPLQVQAQTLPERMKSSGVLIIATNPNYAPITYKDPATNTLTGVDIEIGEAIAKRLGLKVKWEEIAFAQMLPSLQTGRVDIVMAGMADTKARQQVADFVDYMQSGAQFYVSHARAAEFADVSAVCGKKVGAARSTKWPDDLAAWSKENCEAKGLPAVTVIGTEGSADARTQMKTGRIDVGVQGSETLPYFKKLEPNTYAIVGKPFTTALVGIPFLKTPEGNALRAAVKGVLEKMQADGSYDAILAKYDLQGNARKPITENMGQ